MSPPSSRTRFVCEKHRYVPGVKLPVFTKETKKLVIMFNVFKNYVFIYRRREAI